MDVAAAVVVEAIGVVAVAGLTTIVAGVEGEVDTTMETAEDTITIVAAVVTTTITTTTAEVTKIVVEVDTTIVVEADTIIAAEADMAIIAEDMEETAGTGIVHLPTMASNPHGSSTSHLSKADMAVLLRLDGRPLHLLDGMVVAVEELDMEVMIVDHHLSISNPLSNDLLGCRAITVAHLRLDPTITTR
jgi:hypothetical protein